MKAKILSNTTSNSDGLYGRNLGENIMDEKIEEKRLQIFISSTYTDMLEERQAAIETILNTHNIPAGMELFTSGSKSQMEVIKRWIDQSDMYVLILGGRYGSIEPESQKSYTQLEYEYAISTGKPFFAIVIDEQFLDEKVRRNGKSMMEYENYSKYNDFRKLVLSKICVFYTSISDLKYRLSTNIENNSKLYDFTGWVRGKTVNDYAIENAAKKTRTSLEELTKENKSTIDLERVRESCNRYLTVARPLKTYVETLTVETPIGFLNEANNAFSHLVQLLLTEKESELPKFEAHVLRLCIDMYKFSIIALSDVINNFEKNSKNFQKVSGDFFSKFYSLKIQFTEMVNEAKAMTDQDIEYDFESVLLKYENAFNLGNEIYMLIGHSDEFSKTKYYHGLPVWDLR